jgi:hypothetical protein
MKALELHNYLTAQQREHGKTVFRVTELANAAGSSMAAMCVDLNRLRRQGVVEQYTRGRYGLPGVVTVADLLESIDSGAYISGMYALHRYGLVTQVPRRITCVTNKRHNRSRVRTTRVGTLEFVCVCPRIYAPPVEGCLASPEQALCDYVYLCRRAGVDARSQVTFVELDRLDRDELARVAGRYPASVQGAAHGCMEEVRRKT